MNPEENFENQSISRLATKKQSLDDMYSAPANFLEIDVINPQTTIVAGKKKFTDYEIRMRVSPRNLIYDAIEYILRNRFMLIEMNALSLLFCIYHSSDNCVFICKNVK